MNEPLTVVIDRAHWDVPENCDGAGYPLRYGDELAIINDDKSMESSRRESLIIGLGHEVGIRFEFTSEYLKEPLG